MAVLNCLVPPPYSAPELGFRRLFSFLTIFYISLNIQGFSLKVRFNTNSGTRKLGINRIPLFKSLYWTMNMENDNECDDDDDDDDGADNGDDGDDDADGGDGGDDGGDGGDDDGVVLVCVAALPLVSQ